MVKTKWFIFEYRSGAVSENSGAPLMLSAPLFKGGGGPGVPRVHGQNKPSSFFWKSIKSFSCNPNTW